MTNIIEGVELVALNEKLKARGMFTVEQMMDDSVSGLGPFDTHVGVNTFEDVCEWIDRKRLEFTTMRLNQEVSENKDDLFEWVLAHNAAYTGISKHLRKVTSKQDLTIKELQASVSRKNELLQEVMSWIENWSPSFTEDDEWEDTANKVRQDLDTP